MNRVVIGRESALIPSKWEECSTEKQIRILHLIYCNLPREYVRLKAFFLLMNWERPRFWWWEYIQARWLKRFPATRLPTRSEKSEYMRKIFLYWLTDHQRQEFLLLVDWIYTEINFQRSAEGYWVMPNISTKCGGKLPGHGLLAMQWGRFVDVDQTLQRLRKGESEAVNQALAYIFRIYKGKPQEDEYTTLLADVEQMHQVEKDLVLKWYLKCLEHLEECHPLLHEKPEQETEDPYGLVGLTHRLSSSTTDVARMQEMSVWDVMDNLEIRLADAAKQKPTAA